ncbi:mechanosensitive ion channel family protein [Legionella septentrionalis]|uniref:Small-conductance mechanosensitive channel n=1 Tax=Legionella septentrionalis TaxID=2498109 RepID=A0A3S0VBZ9_9GAMM|nr:mechanosensitive ion channel family protein [Legionella septentrionalis]RUQ91519.1 mechanosensitive ion channel family protein [Legionella septentrionalis]
MQALTAIGWVKLGYAVLLFILGFFLAKRLSAMVTRAFSKHFSVHQTVLARRLVFYGLLLIFVISALQQLGVQMSVLLGAAGVFTVALSFASQTAASNLISGIFLLFERPFKIGDTIQVKDMVGAVDSIDFLSTKIKTADNVRIRIPNETLMKSEIINMSYFKTRKTEILLRIRQHNNLERAKGILLQLVHANKSVLKTPAPQVVVSNFNDAALELKLSLWTHTKDTAAVKAELYELITQRFDKEDIAFQQAPLLLR